MFLCFYVIRTALIILGGYNDDLIIKNNSVRRLECRKKIHHKCYNIRIWMFGRVVLNGIESSSRYLEHICCGMGNGLLMTTLVGVCQE